MENQCLGSSSSPRSILLGHPHHHSLSTVGVEVVVHSVFPFHLSIYLSPRFVSRDRFPFPFMLEGRKCFKCGACEHLLN